MSNQQGTMPSTSAGSSVSFQYPDSNTATQMNTFRSYVSMLSDATAKDEIKLKAAQELSEHFEVITSAALFPQFLEFALRIFIRVLNDGEPQFIGENTQQHVRKLILEMIHRFPISEHLRPSVKPIIQLMFKLLRLENEENVLICLRIIIDYHKQFRPPFSPEINQFLSFVKTTYTELPKHVDKIFEQQSSSTIRVKDLKELDLKTILSETYSTRTIHVEKQGEAGPMNQTYNLLPKGSLSLKVLQELPIIVVLMYQIYKATIQNEVADFVPHIMTTITLQPSVVQRTSQHFNREIFVDFMGAQVKTLSFLAYIVRIFQETIASHANSVVKGTLTLMQLCPKEAASYRKELLIAARHIFATDLRVKFIPIIDNLFDEELLIGKGVTLDSIRPLAYSTLADLAHHVRQSLSLEVLEKAANLYSKNVHDETLATGIQTMSCKLLFNLVDCIKQQGENEPVKARKLLITLLKVFTLKFQTIAKIQLPQIMQKWKASQNSPAAAASLLTSCPLTAMAVDQKDNGLSLDAPVTEQNKLCSIGFPAPNSMNVVEYRSLVKTLVGGAKTITWGCVNSKSTATENMTQQAKMFQAHELNIFIDLVYWALEAFDIYTINIPNLGTTNLLQQKPQNKKEEKEVMEHFSGIFIMMNSQNFQEIFTITIDYMVERINKNPCLQDVASSFLANRQTSPLFATVLVEYLLERMEEMGSNLERSNLYLKLFKLVFGSVSLFAAENEHMLRPHLHNIVNRSMELAMTAKEPYNYFLLLRALFRSIGGGSHDLLYQEFLPLLPNLLEGLNRLQSGFHKQHMKDLFVELCLTVPVRLSSLLPYLPMLMDPLVSALNGSRTLVSQGLRTLELCVDNLQPDFLYEHIQPVRADLMQALWRTLRNSDNSATVAFRVLGKFGGGNRKMMIEPQKLEYNTKKDSPVSSIVAHFVEHQRSIDFPMDKVIETAYNALNSKTTDQFYRKQSWEVIRCFLAASINSEDEKHILSQLFMHPSFLEENINSNVNSYKSLDAYARQTHQKALAGMLVAAATKELSDTVIPVMVAVVRHYTMVAIAQQAGPFPTSKLSSSSNNSMFLDPLVLVDALAFCMAHEEKELCKPGQLCIGLILKTATTIMGSKERACRLPLMQYLADRMALLCYDRPWYAKMGGCKALRCLYQHMSLRWLYQHLFMFLKAFLFVMMDLAGEVSSGAVDMAKNYLENMLRICMVPLDKDCEDKELVAIHEKAMSDVILELVRQVTSPNALVRQEAMASLKLIAELQSKTITEVMNPHSEILADIVPPKKHLLRHQPACAQIGLMEGNTFCTTLEPKLFSIDLNNTYHKLFFQELLALSDAEDSVLLKLDCYKNVTNMGPLRKSALKALAACHYITDTMNREKILNILFKVMEKNNADIQDAAYECMKKFFSGIKCEKDIITTGIRPLLQTLGDYRTLTLNGTRRLSYFTQLFPQMFNEKLCEQLIQHIQKLLEKSIAQNKSQQPQFANFLSVAKTGEEEQIIFTLIGIYHQIPAATSKYIESLCQLILRTEKSINIEQSCPFRAPLIKFLLRFPGETVNLFMNDTNIFNAQWNRFLIFLLKHKDGMPFRVFTQTSKISRLIELIQGNTPATSVSEEERYEAQHQGVLIVHTLMELDEQWLPTQVEIINALKIHWNTNLYKTCGTNVACDMWHLVGKILLFYFSHNTDDIELLFQLLSALCLHFIPYFHFLRDFLQNTVAQSFTVDWKRKSFFYFVENFNNPAISDDVKAKILTAVLIPCFAVSFDKGEGNKLIGAPPAPYQEDENNIVSVFISRVIDPDRSFLNEDAIRIALLQFACLLVERASPHIHDGDANNRRQGNKLRRLMTFAWPCLISRNCVDPTARYHGHLLLSHIIARLAIHKKIVLQVFHSLLKGHALEARPIVRQALEVLTPAMPLRMEDGNTMLTHWTKKIITEEGHSTQQLFHILNLIVRHHKVYYPVRHHLIQSLLNYMQRFGLQISTSLEHRKIAFELAEVVVKWEVQRIKDENNVTEMSEDTAASLNGGVPVKRPSSDDLNNDNRKRLNTGETTPTTESAAATPANPASRPIDKHQCDMVLNFLMKLACNVNEPQSTPGIVSPGETLSRRCVFLIKTAMRPDVWILPFDLKLSWMDKIFGSIETQQANFGNICTALELLAYLLTILKKDQVLTIIRSIQRGLSACVASQNTRVIRLMHAFLTRLMGMFPPDVTHKNDEFELYGVVSKSILEGLQSQSSSLQQQQQAGQPVVQPPPASSLFGVLMILKACCTSNPAYIDRLIIPFMKVLTNLCKEHFGQGLQQAVPIGGGVPGEPTPSNHSVAVELLILSLELVKNRIVVMNMDVRKVFISQILGNLIEKSTEVKVIKAIIKMLEDWMKNKNQLPVTVQQAPTLREKSILLVKLMQYVEKRFSDDLDVNAQFLELINFIYRDENLKHTELTQKLEPAFLAGLRCNQPLIRAKFFEIFDGSMRRRLHDRLLYVIIQQAWDSIGNHYWIKQCIELLILTANPSKEIQNSFEQHVIPSISSVINSADSEEKKNFVVYTPIEDISITSTVNTEAPIDSEKEEEFDEMMNASVESTASRREDSERTVPNRSAALKKLISQQAEFLESNRKIRTEQLLVATAQLCHMDTELAEKVWLDVFPRIWSILDEDQQQAIVRDLVPFLASGTHVVQKECHPSAISTFVEALTRCQPQIYLPPNLMTYLAKGHNLWHRMTLLLEDMSVDWHIKREKFQENSDIDISEYDLLENHNNSVIYDPLSQMYSALHEEDLWAGLWLKYAQYPETNTAIAYEQMGFFEEAQGAYDLAMSKYKQDFSNSPALISLNNETNVWEEHWIRCAKELNQWDILLDYAQNSRDMKNFLIMESAWRVPDWDLMKQALTKVEQSSPKQGSYKVYLYRGFLAILHKDDQQLQNVERCVELASHQCMREWRRLPHIVSHIHLKYLQAAQQIMELQEASQIHTGLQPNRPTALHDMKAIVKTWRNRLPVIADDLSHWSDIFTWRQHHYQIITNYLEKPNTDTTNTMLGVHASAQAIIHFGKIARKHNLTGVCIESLSRIYTIPSVPIVDCFQKIRQQVKCYVQMASVSGRMELNEALETIESTNLNYFTPEMTAEFYALKGLLLAQMGKSEDSNKAFSASCQLHDNLTKAWALWADYLEKIFIQDPANISFGVDTITCFLHACRHQSESKTRKYLAKVLWLLSYDDSKHSLINALEKYAVGVPWHHWLPWIPQLLCCLVQIESNVMMNLLSQVGRMFPQSVYFPIRTLYLTLKIEQREKHKTHQQNQANNSTPEQSGSNSQGQQSNPQQNPQQGQPIIKATLPMWRCSKVMHAQREVHPTILSCLEGIVDQMVWFRENWHEEVLRQLRQGLIKCYAIAFENKNLVNEANITPHTLHFVKKLVSTFGIGIENISPSVVTTAGSSAASESLAKRAQQTMHDPVFHKLKTQFTNDFDFTHPDAMKLHNLISKLKKWIKLLELKTKHIPKSLLIEEKCRFLSNFSHKTAEIELPGELLLPGVSHYHIRIARFMPKVEVVQKHNTAARRLYIRGTNGKIYPYLVTNDSGLADARREERVLQLLKMLNQYLSKQKETSRRFLHITVPRVAPVSPQMRWVEDNPASISLLDIYKSGCQKVKIEHDTPIARYYERLAEVQARGTQTSHTVLRDILKEVQKNMVPRTLLKDWAIQNFKSATDYWQFRKMFTLQLALASLCEHALHLTRLNADMMYLHQDSGLMNVSYFKFEVDDSTGNLEASRSVPFRLTPNISEFLSPFGISGTFSASVVATARCLVQPNFKLPSILQAILRDEIIAVHRKRFKDDKPNVDSNGDITDNTPKIDMENIINVVNNNVAAIMSRLNSISYFDNMETNKIASLIQAATNPDFLCRMDPAWHPWL